MTPRSGIIIRLIAKMNMELKEMRRQMLPTATTFLPRDSQSNFLRPSGGKRQSRASSPLGLPKEFAQMEQKLQEMYPKEEDRLFYYHSSEDLYPCIIAVPSLEGL